MAILPCLIIPQLFSHRYPTRRQSAWFRAWDDLDKGLQPYHTRLKGTWRLSRLAQTLADPQRAFDRWRGREDFSFPYDRPNLRPTTDILHLHNLHGGYFDLRQLPRLSQTLPTFITLHDTWLLSGHCAYSNGCQRWQIGCGHCPDLTLYPATPRDATAQNWQRKAAPLRPHAYISSLPRAG